VTVIERAITILNRLGLHARPAAEFVKVAGKFESEITLRKEDMEVNGKSIMGVMTLAAECGSVVVLRANGADAEDAVDALAKVLAKQYTEI